MECNELRRRKCKAVRGEASWGRRRPPKTGGRLAIGPRHDLTSAARRWTLGAEGFAAEAEAEAEETWWRRGRRRKRRCWLRAGGAECVDGSGTLHKTWPSKAVGTRERCSSPAARYDSPQRLTPVSAPLPEISAFSSSRLESQNFDFCALNWRDLRKTEEEKRALIKSIAALVFCINLFVCSVQSFVMFFVLLFFQKRFALFRKLLELRAINYFAQFIYFRKKEKNTISCPQHVF